MEPYDQEKEDRSGFYISMGVICGLVAIGAIMTDGIYDVIGFLAIVLCVYLFKRAG